MTHPTAEQPLGSPPAAEVVIIGAGPTGVTAAILLGQAGVRTLVLDRWTEVFPQPRAVHLDDEVFRILDRLGVAEDFRRVSIPGAGLRLLSPDHTTLAQFDRTEAQTSNGFPQASMFDQPDLETILRQRMNELDSVTFIGNVEVTKVNADLGESPSVVYTDRTTQETVIVKPRFVLGCDGANSIVRSAIGSTMRNLGFKEQRWLVVDIATERELGHWPGVHQVCDSHRAATYMQIGSSRHRWEFELLDQETTADFETLTQLAPLLRPWEATTDGFELVRLTDYTFRAQVADIWRRGNTFILGDAAHLTPPFIGQGMGAGIRDAANLSWKIAAVLRDELPTAVLDSYEDERKPHARSLVRLATMVGRSMTGGGRIGDQARRVIVPLLPKLPGLRNKVLDSTTPALTRSSLNLRGRFTPGIIGTLCPNTLTRTGTTFDRLSSGRFTLVCSSCVNLQATAVPPHVVLINATDEAELRAWLGDTQAALIRPDGTCAVAGSIDAVLNSAAYQHLCSSEG